MTTFVQQLVNGIDLGAIYALFAVGFSLIFGVYGIFNLAQSTVLSWGMFAAYLSSGALHLGFGLSLLASLVAGALASLCVDFFAFRPLRARAAPAEAALVTSIGAWFVLEDALEKASNDQVDGFPVSLFPNLRVSLGGVSITLLDVVVVACSVALTVALVGFMHHTRFGRRVRAVSVDSATARLFGVKPAPIYLFVFALCGAFAGGAGVLLGILYGSFTYNVGDDYLLIGIAAIVAGGMGSVSGAFIGGLGMGIIQTLTVQYISSEWSFAGPFIVLFLVIVVRPSGILGKFDATRRVGRV